MRPITVKIHQIQHQSPIDHYYVIPADAQHYVYIFEATLKTIDGGEIEYVLTFESTFENHTTTGPIFKTSIKYTIEAISITADSAEELHNLLDIGYLYHLKALQKKLAYTGYASKVPLTIDTIRFGSLITSLILDYNQA